MPLLITLNEFDGSNGRPDEGFNVQVGVDVWPLQNDIATIYGQNANFNNQTQSWEANIPSPQNAGTYRLTVYAYCARDNSTCAIRYGTSRQISWNYIFTVGSPTPTITPTPTPNLNPPLCGQSSIPPATGPAPLTVLLHGAADAGSGPGFDGYRWDFDGNGTWDTDTLSEPVTHVYTTPGSYIPLFQVHGTNNVWSALCTYPYTITVASLTPTPTPTPMPQNLEFLVKLGGVTGNSATGAQINVKFNKSDGTTLPFTSPLTLSYVSDGVYKADAVLTNPFPAGTKYTVQIKGEKHAAITFTHQSSQTNQCSDSAYITEPNPVPQAMTFDFSGVPLPPGDTNPQDGQVDQTDINHIVTLMGKSSGSLTPQDLLTGDLNYDGKIDVNDLFWIYKTLQTRCD